MLYPVIVTLSGPEKTRAKAELALEKANLTVIPPTEWPVSRKSYAAKDWPHLTALPSGQPPDEEHGFLAVLAETEQAFHAAYGVVAKAKWVLRVHHELPEKPKPDPVSELIDGLTRRLDNQARTIAELSRKLGLPPGIEGGAFETGAGEFMQAGSYSAAQLRRTLFSWAARTSANTPGLITGGLLSSTDMQLSNAESGLVVYTSTGECLIPGTETTSQGGYHAFLSSQSSTTLATANASNPRIDLICATSADAQYSIPSGGTSGYVTLQAVTGTPTSGATLSNLYGAPSSPASSLLLGYVLVPAAATSLSSLDILNVAPEAVCNPSFLATVPPVFLAKPQFVPSSSTTVNLTTSGTWYCMSGAAIGPVTIPASGNVFVRYSGGTVGGNGSEAVYISTGVSTSSTVSPLSAQQYALGTVPTSGQSTYMRYAVDALFTGLTAGDTVTFYPWAVSGGGAGSWYAGPPSDGVMLAYAMAA